METLVTYSLDKGKPLWPVFAIADRMVNKLGGNGIEGCRFELNDFGSMLSLKVPDGQLDAAVKVATTSRFTR